MQVLHPCNSFTFSTPPIPLNKFIIYNLATPTFPLPSCTRTKTSNFKHGFCQRLYFVTIYAISRTTHVSFCSKGEILEDFTSTHWSKDLNFDKNGEVEELELQNKPSPMPISDEIVVEVEEEPKKLDREEVLQPFLRFFKPRDLGRKVSDLDELEVSSEESESDEVEEEGNEVGFEYYDPKPGDFIVGVVVSGNENKIDVNIGADVLGIMLKKDVLPLFDKELDYLLCDIEKDADDFMVKGRMGILKNEGLVSGEIVGPGRPVVEPGTVLFAEVLGRTLSGKPLISTRRYFRRLAWHRVWQIKQFNEPIEVKITEWNSNGLLTRIEGLRAFLPKAELVNRTNTFTELKENVGRCIHVQITRINESTNDLVLSKKEAWSLLHLKEGTLLDGTVKNIFPYGAQIRIGDSNRRFSKGLAEGNVPEELKTVLSSVAAKWGDVIDFNMLKVIHLSGAMTNEVYQITWPTTTNGVLRNVLLRIYGEGVDIFFDRDEEIQTFYWLSKHGHGPRLLGQFTEGRVEEFIHAKTLSASDLRDPETSALIAAKLREFHTLKMPGSKNIILWDRMRDWLTKARNLCSNECAKEFHLDTLADEIDIVEKDLSQNPQDIVFCHNDLQYGNIMIDEKTRSITIIDYEYASYNPAAYDLAKHFCEMAANYHSETPHVLDYNIYPGLEERERFVRSYLSSTGHEPSESEVKRLVNDVEKYTLANHLFWGLWGIISAHVSNIDFDYMEYARQRFEQYWLRKPQLLPMATKAISTDAEDGSADLTS